MKLVFNIKEDTKTNKPYVSNLHIEFDDNDTLNGREGKKLVLDYLIEDLTKLKQIELCLLKDKQIDHV